MLIKQLKSFYVSNNINNLFLKLWAWRNAMIFYFSYSLIIFENLSNLLGYILIFYNFVSVTLCVQKTYSMLKIKYLYVK